MVSDKGDLQRRLKGGEIRIKKIPHPEHFERMSGGNVS